MMIMVEGKTKIVRQGTRETTVILETKDVLTGGDAARREVIEDIGIHKTTQAANIFSLLNRKGIPTAFIERMSPNELLCHKCKMLPLEFVVRRYAWGSYLQRHPEYKKENDEPWRFKCPTWEIFHKSTVIDYPITDKPYQIDEYTAREQFLHDGIWQEGVYTDPYIKIKKHEWALYPPKYDVAITKPIMEISPACYDADLKYIVDKLLVPTFRLLEKALSGIETEYGSITLVDLKIEVGRRVDNGQLVIADVIDNDSWRIWVGCNPKRQLDKQCFRDGNPLIEVAGNYAIVAGMTYMFNDFV